MAGKNQDMESSSIYHIEGRTQLTNAETFLGMLGLLDRSQVRKGMVARVVRFEDRSK